MNCPFCKSVNIQCISADDDPNKGYAWNLYQCVCGTIVRNNIWNNKSIIAVSPKNEVIVIADSYILKDIPNMIRRIKT